MIWDTLIWRLECSNRSKIRSAQKCNPCLRYELSPMSPGRTVLCWRRGWDSNPRMEVLQTSPLGRLGTAPDFPVYQIRTPSRQRGSSLNRTRVDALPSVGPKSERVPCWSGEPTDSRREFPVFAELL